MVAQSDSLVDVPEGASITLADTVDFDGVTLTKTGGGLLRVSEGSSSGSGTVQLNEGTLDWRGDLRGDLSAAGGTITPAGAIRGRLDVRGSFTLGEGASLELDIRGLSSSSNDLVTVDSQADLGGTLEIDFHDGFRPAPGSQLLVMLAAIGIVALTLTAALGLKKMANYLKQKKRDKKRKSFLEHMSLEGGWQAPSRGKLHCWPACKSLDDIALEKLHHMEWCNHCQKTLQNNYYSYQEAKKERRKPG